MGGERGERGEYSGRGNSRACAWRLRIAGGTPVTGNLRMKGSMGQATGEMERWVTGPWGPHGAGPPPDDLAFPKRNVITWGGGVGLRTELTQGLFIFFLGEASLG